MSQEQIQKQKQIPKQREYEYTAPFPVPEIPEDELKALADLAIEHIDEVTGD